MDQGRTKLEIPAREWLVWLATGVVVFVVAIEAEQTPLAMAASSVAVLALFGLLWRLLAVPPGGRQDPRH